ncbi:MAG: SEC-C domain-containing protein [Oscillospiraceae bacterium]|jgi:hypothetical protein|nr:SEC-C domain-containing protein [Oscillospiraceae bacterium]
MKNEETGAVDTELREYLLSIYREFNIERATKGKPLRKLWDTLAARSLTALRKLAKAHKIRGYTKMDKTELAAALAERLSNPGALGEIFLSMHDTEWRFFKKVAVTGQLQDDEAFAGEYREAQDLGIIYLYLHDGRLYFVVPDEIRAVYVKLKKTKLPAERDFCWMVNVYAAAAANLYGVISLNDFAALFNSQNKRRVGADDIFVILLRYAHLDAGYDVWRDYIISEDFAAEDFETVERFAKGQASKPRYIPQKAEFIECADILYYELVPQTAALRMYIEDSLGADSDTAHNIADGLFVAFRSEATEPDAVAMFEAHGVKPDMAQLRDALALVTDMGDNTRRWALNGYTPKELRRREQSRSRPAAETPRRVGRNDPCPCGSGKKYKKCCYLKEQ